MTRRVLTVRPIAAANPAIDAIEIARSTEGSNRVTSAKNINAALSAANRKRKSSRSSNGASNAATKATLAPETANRCPRPEPRKSSAMTDG